MRSELNIFLKYERTSCHQPEMVQSSDRIRMGLVSLTQTLSDSSPRPISRTGNCEVRVCMHLFFVITARSLAVAAFSNSIPLNWYFRVLAYCRWQLLSMICNLKRGGHEIALTEVTRSDINDIHCVNGTDLSFSSIIL